MEIKTKFNIGDKIWIVYRTDVEISMYVDTIIEISYNEDLGVMYFSDICSEEIKENEIILKDDVGKLLSTIENLQHKIDEEEAERYDDERGSDRPDDSVLERISNGESDRES